MQKLFELLANPELIKELNESQIKVLLPLADYLAVPQSLLEIFAMRTLNLFKKIQNPDQETVDLINRARCCMAGSDNIEGLINQFADDITIFYDQDNNVINLSKIGKKRLSKLEGIEQFREYLPCKEIIAIDLSGHKLTDFNISQLLTVFPNLRKLNLADNEIIKLEKKQLGGMCQKASD